MKNGGVWCWGDNSFGELGNNTTTESHLPVAVLFSNPASVGGVAEEPEVTALPSAASVQGRDYTVYILDVAVAILIAAGVSAWSRRRRSR